MAIEPRVPLRVTSISGLPKNTHGAEKIACLSDEWKRREVNLAPLFVHAAQPYDAGNGLFFRVSQHQGPLFDRNRIAIKITDGKKRSPFGGQHIARFIVALIENDLGVLVVINERAFGVDDDYRRGEMAGQLPGKNDFYGLEILFRL